MDMELKGLEEEIVCEACARTHGEISVNQALREVIDDLDVCCFSRAQPRPSLSATMACVGDKRKSSSAGGDGDDEEKACMWTGKFSAAEAHYFDCPFALAVCKNDCGSTMVRSDLAAHLELCRSDCPNGCGALVAGKHMARHLDGCRSQCLLGCGALVGGNEREQHARTCPQRTVACEWCLEAYHFQAVGNHRRDCDMRHVHCPNKCFTADGGAAVQVPYGDVDEHLLTCPMQQVRCCFSSVGCETALPRCEMAAHERDPNHMVVLCRRISLLENDVAGAIAQLQSDAIGASRTVAQIQNDATGASRTIEQLQIQLQAQAKKIKQIDDDY